MNATWRRLRWQSSPRYNFEKDRAFRKALQWWIEERGPRPPEKSDPSDSKNWMESEHMQLFCHINTLVPYNCYPGDVCEAVEQELHGLQMEASKKVTEKDIDRVVNDIEDEFHGMLAGLINNREQSDKRVPMLNRECNISGTDLMAMVAIKIGLRSDRGLDRWRDMDEHGQVFAFRERARKEEDKWDREHEKLVKRGEIERD